MYDAAVVHDELNEGTGLMEADLAKDDGFLVRGRRKRNRETKKQEKVFTDEGADGNRQQEG